MPHNRLRRLVDSLGADLVLIALMITVWLIFAIPLL